MADTDLQCDLDIRLLVNAEYEGNLRMKGYATHERRSPLSTDSVDALSESGRLVILARNTLRDSERYWCASPEEPRSWKKLDRLSLLPLFECQSAVLSTEESDETVGNLSLSELSERISELWGGILPTAITTSSIYTEWLTYFITKKHNFGIVHAWIGALRIHAVSELYRRCTEGSPYNRQERILRKVSVPVTLRGCPLSVPSAHVDNEDGEVLAGLVAPLLGRKFDTLEGGQRIIASDSRKAARRIWDVCANRIIPMSWLPESVPILTWPGLVHISHAWVAFNEIKFVLTNVNGCTWPVPIPQDVGIEDIRNDLLRHNIIYAWLDVLCLRQDIESKPGLLKELGTPYTPQEIEERKNIQDKEWASDVPLIGWTYRQKNSLVLVYLNGLGKSTMTPQEQVWEGERHWLRRTWTMQEVVDLGRMVFLGYDDPRHLLDYKIPFLGVSFSEAMAMIGGRSRSEAMALPALISSLQSRFSTNPVDKVGGLLYFCLHERQLLHDKDTQPRDNTGDGHYLPTYKREETLEDAWSRLVTATAHVWTNICESCEKHTVKYGQEGSIEISNRFHHFTEQLLMLFPHPSAEHWFPSWNQVMEFPDVSVQEPQLSDDLQPAMNCALRLFGGHVYRKIRLQKVCIDGKDGYSAISHQDPSFSGDPSDAPSKPMTLYPYDSAWGHHPNISEDQDYVLVDITTNNNRWSGFTPNWSMVGQSQDVTHPLILCRELRDYDTSFISELHSAGRTPSPAFVGEDKISTDRGFEKRPPNAYEVIPPRLRYELRRVTTLKWHGPISQGEAVRLPFPPVLDSPPDRRYRKNTSEIWYNSWHPSIRVSLQ